MRATHQTTKSNPRGPYIAKLVLMWRVYGQGQHMQKILGYILLERYHREPQWPQKSSRRATGGRDGILHEISRSH